jgi:hypothetical protein
MVNSGAKRLREVIDQENDREKYVSVRSPWEPIIELMTSGTYQHRLDYPVQHLTAAPV